MLGSQRQGVDRPSLSSPIAPSGRGGNQHITVSGTKIFKGEVQRGEAVEGSRGGMCLGHRGQRRVFLKRGSLRIRGHQPCRDTVGGMEGAKAPRWECAGQVPDTEEAGMAGTG